MKRAENEHDFRKSVCFGPAVSASLKCAPERMNFNNVSHVTRFPEIFCFCASKTRLNILFYKGGNRSTPTGGFRTILSVRAIRTKSKRKTQNGLVYTL